MLKYLAAVLVLVFGLAVYISVQDERSAQKAAQPDEGALVAKAEENHTQQNVPNPEGNSPRWYRFFRWPDGTTTWVIFLTLLAIAEQARETKNSVIMSLRPKLSIRGIALVEGKYVRDGNEKRIEDDHVWQLECLIANTGGTDARITESNVTIANIEKVGGELPTFPPYDNNRDSFGIFSIIPGEHRQILMPLVDNDTFRFRLLREMRKNAHVGGESRIYCLGFIQYRDGMKIERRTAFCLQYDAQTGRFNRIVNPDYEYAD